MTEHEHQWADTGVIRCSICRITKDDLWNLATTICPLTCKHDITDHSGDCYDLADFILARWRLVPVEEPCRCIAGNEHYKSDHAAQHRAADELTQHDQAAGIYDDCQPCTDLRTAMLDLHQRGFSDRQIAERLGMSTRTIANRRRKLGLQYNDGKAIRTDMTTKEER